MSWWSSATEYGKNLTSFVKNISTNDDDNCDKVIKGEEFEIENVNVNENKNKSKFSLNSIKNLASKATSKANEWKEYMNEIAVVKDEEDDIFNKDKEINKEEDKSGIKNSNSILTDLSAMARKASQVTANQANKIKDYVSDMSINDNLADFSKIVKEKGEKIKKMVDEVAKDTLLGELDRENLKYIEELENEKLKSCIELPWIGMPDEVLAQKRILSLSLDAKNFTGHVPEVIGYTTQEIDSLASLMIDKDPHLRNMRASLVPREINEEKFWKNYAYKVYIVRKILLDDASIDSEIIEKEEDNSKKEELMTSPGKVSETTDDDWEKEIIDNLDFEAIMKETGHKTDEQWEAEIEEILENDK
uniref:BSD domain-containing protein n=1 Tax=Parastrongyloides trichosuri TaxID=131310 RepID=A0A0N4ZFV1_PARTI